MTDRITACPSCDSAKIKLNSTRRVEVHDRWRCIECGTHFDEPVRRKRHHTGSETGGSPAVKALLEADSEVVSR